MRILAMDEQLLQSMTKTIVDTVDPEEIILFGSQATGTAHDLSDVDPLVVLTDSEETRRHRLRLTGDIYRSLAAFPVSKDILVYTRHEVDRWRGVSGHVVATSLREGKRLYARP